MASEPASPEGAELFLSDQIVSGFNYLFTQVRLQLLKNIWSRILISVVSLHQSFKLETC